MSLTDKAMARIRELIQTGELPPGSKLPPEPQLAAELGVGRNIMREAVRALVAARVLEVRRGSGTFVTSLEPKLLLEGIGAAVELLQGDTMLELTEVRRLFEPAATALAATRITAQQLAEVHDHLEAMRAAIDDVELLNEHDAAFHRAVVAATGNQTLSTVLDGISGRTVRARVWRGLVNADTETRVDTKADTQADVAGQTLREHEAIYAALVSGDALRAHAAAFMHVTTTETWLRGHLRDEQPA